MTEIERQINSIEIAKHTRLTLEDAKALIDSLDGHLEVNKDTDITGFLYYIILLLLKDINNENNN